MSKSKNKLIKGLEYVKENIGFEYGFDQNFCVNAIDSAIEEIKKSNQEGRVEGAKQELKSLINDFDNKFLLVVWRSKDFKDYIEKRLKELQEVKQ